MYCVAGTGTTGRMTNASLVVMAAGLGSRIGGVKQLAAVGPAGVTDGGAAALGQDAPAAAAEDAHLAA